VLGKPIPFGHEETICTWEEHSSCLGRIQTGNCASICATRTSAGFETSGLALLSSPAIGGRVCSSADRGYLFIRTKERHADTGHVFK
jgi:hypothetical protein